MLIEAKGYLSTYNINSDMLNIEIYVHSLERLRY